MPSIQTELIYGQCASSLTPVVAALQQFFLFTHQPLKILKLDKHPEHLTQRADISSARLSKQAVRWAPFSPVEPLNWLFKQTINTD